MNLPVWIENRTSEFRHAVRMIREYPVDPAIVEAE